MISRPNLNDAPAYFRHYVEMVPESDLLEALENSLHQSLALFATISNDKELFRYAPEKWTTKQVVSHIIDCERVYAYRALRFSRRDATELPPFDENLYAAHANADARLLGQMSTEYSAVRRASIELFRSMSNEMLDLKGIANNVTMTPRSLGWLIAGHNLHHCRILKDKYL
jgi:uncharacterized damage-inducible protein DinB